MLADTLNSLSLNSLNSLCLSLLLGKRDAQAHDKGKRERSGIIHLFLFHLFVLFSLLSLSPTTTTKATDRVLVLFSWKPQTPPTQSFHNPTTKSKTPNSQAGTTFVVVGKRINTIIRHKDG